MFNIYNENTKINVSQIEELSKIPTTNILAKGIKLRRQKIVTNDNQW